MSNYDGKSLDFPQVLKRAYREDIKGFATTTENSLVRTPFDSFKKTNTSDTVETFDYYLGGLSGILVTTVVITYTSSSKDDIVSAERTFEL